MVLFLRFLLIFFITACFSFLYWMLYGMPEVGIDDANIYFVYVRNFAEGHGFVYNIGSERVEGFTSILWTLILVVLYKVSPEHYMMLSMVLNLFLTTITLWIASRIIDLGKDRLRVCSPMLALLLSLLFLLPGYIEWSILTMMENGIWGFIMMLIVYHLLLINQGWNVRKHLYILSLLLPLLVVIRPESLLWGIVFVVLIVAVLSGRTLKERIKLAAVPAASFLLAIALLTAFRILYFGYPLPNTYYAKVSGDSLYNIVSGVRYFLLNAVSNPVLWIVSAMTVFVLAIVLTRVIINLRNGKWLEEKAFLHMMILCSVSAVSLFIPIYVGGDHFKLMRFFQAFFPIYWIMFFQIEFFRQYLLQLDLKKAWYTNSWFLLCLLIPFIYLSTEVPLHKFRKGESPIQWEFDLAELGMEKGTKMTTLFGQDGLPSVGLDAAGGFKYTYPGNVIDLMGLNNTLVAHKGGERKGMKNHAAFNREAFFELEPQIFHGYFSISMFVEDKADTVILENSPGFGFEDEFVARLYKGLFFDQRFVDSYFPAIISKPHEPGGLKTYVHKDFIEELITNGYEVYHIPRSYKSLYPAVNSINH